MYIGPKYWVSWWLVHSSFCHAGASMAWIGRGRNELWTSHFDIQSVYNLKVKFIFLLKITLKAKYYLFSENITRWELDATWTFSNSNWMLNNSIIYHVIDGSLNTWTNWDLWTPTMRYISYWIYKLTSSFKFSQFQSAEIPQYREGIRIITK